MHTPPFTHEESVMKRVFVGGALATFALLAVGIPAAVA